MIFPNESRVFRSRAALLPLLAAVAVACCAAAAPSVAAGPDVARQVTIREPLGRPWAAQLLHWPAPDAALWHLTTLDGKTVASQLSRGAAVCPTPLDGPGIYALVDLPAGGTVDYQLQPGAPPAGPAAPVPGTRVVRDAAGVSLGNDLITVRLCPPGTPGPDGAIAAPLTGLRAGDSTWPIAGRVSTAAGGIERWDVEVTAEGPIFAEAVVRYWSGKLAVYQCRVRVVARQPVVHLAEEFALGEQATLAMTVESPTVLDTVDGLYLKGKKHLVAPTQRTLSAQDLGPLVRLLPWQSYYAPGTGAWFAAWKAQDAQPVLGVFTTFPQCWTRPGGDPHDSQWSKSGPPAIAIEREAEQRISLRLALDRGTRCWGILLQQRGAFDAQTPSGIAAAKRLYGETPLQKVKDWTLDWQSAAAHPDLLFSAADLPAMNKRLQGFPEAARRFAVTTKTPVLLEDLTCSYLLKPDREVARRIVHGDGEHELAMEMQAMGLLPELRLRVQSLLDGYGIWPVGPNDLMWLPDHLLYRLLSIDVMLGAPEISQADKDEIRRLLALIAYQMQSPEMLPPHENYQWGTPNMPAGWFAVLGMIGCVLADHPAAASWRSFAVQGLRGQVLWLSQPDGTYCESYFYQERVNRALVPALAALARHGDDDLLQDPRTIAFFTQQIATLMPADPRNGVRNIAPIGDATWYHHKASLLAAAALLAGSAPLQAQQLAWAWQQQGSPLEDLVYGNLYYYSALLGDPQQQTTAPPLTSQTLAGGGAILRSRFAGPGETFLHLRAADFATSHFEADQLALHWVAKGVPLCLDWGYYFNPDTRGPEMHSRPFSAADGSGRGRVAQSVFLPGADFILAQSRAAQPTQRRLLLVKAAELSQPEFVLLRDSLPGPGFTSLWVAAQKLQMQLTSQPAKDQPLDEFVLPTPTAEPGVAVGAALDGLLRQKDRTLEQNLSLLALPRFSNDRGHLPAFSVPLLAPHVDYHGPYGADLQVRWLTAASHVEMGAYQWGMGKADSTGPLRGEHQKLLRLHRTDAGDIVLALVPRLREVEPAAQMRPWGTDGLELIRPDGWRYLAWLAPHPVATPAIASAQLACSAIAIGFHHERLSSLSAVALTAIEVEGIRVSSDHPRHIDLRRAGDKLTIEVQSETAGRVMMRIPGLHAAPAQGLAVAADGAIELTVAEGNSRYVVTLTGAKESQ